MININILCSVYKSFYKYIYTGVIAIMIAVVIFAVCAWKLRKQRSNKKNGNLSADVRKGYSEICTHSFTGA